MPSQPRPFKAVVPFSCANQHYAAGDVVDNPVVLATVRAFGDQFVSAAPPAAKTKKES